MCEGKIYFQDPKETNLQPYFSHVFQLSSKNITNSSNQQDTDGRDEYLDEIVRLYESALLGLQTVDFDLATKWSVRLVEEQEFVGRSLESKYPWLLVDEYQDLGLALHRIVKALTVQTGVKLFAIGDPKYI